VIINCQINKRKPFYKFTEHANQYYGIKLTDKFYLHLIFCSFTKINKRAQRALGHSPEEKVKGHNVAIYRRPQWHNVNNFGRGPLNDAIY